jgi:secondary thiamine-phosphate synthase enzyme
MALIDTRGQRARHWIHPFWSETTMQFTVKTRSQTELIDITASVQDVVHKTGLEEGLCFVFIPHTTAAVTINENADPDVTRDMIMELNKIVPFDDGYRHLEGNSAAHLKSSI